MSYLFSDDYDSQTDYYEEADNTEQHETPEMLVKKEINALSQCGDNELYNKISDLWNQLAKESKKNNIVRIKSSDNLQLSDMHTEIEALEAQINDIQEIQENVIYQDCKNIWDAVITPYIEKNNTILLKLHPKYDFIKFYEMVLNSCPVVRNLSKDLKKLKLAKGKLEDKKNEMKRLMTEDLY